MAATERLWVLLACAATPWLAGHAEAQSERGSVSAGTHVYTDTDQLTVIHPAVVGQLRLGEGTQLDVGYDADIVSAATVDVRTSASVRPFEETRHGARAGVTQSLTRTMTVGGGYALSYSPDYQSHTVGLRTAIEDDARVHTFGVGLKGSYSLVGRRGDPHASGDLFGTGITGTWAAVVNRWLVTDVGVAVEWQHGFLESPYRFVAIRPPGGQGRVYVPERVPDDRLRGAISLRVRAALSDEAFARASYRLHADDWGVAGHTVRLEGTWTPTPDLRVSATFRFLAQRGASFYQGRYVARGVPSLRTRDRELARAVITSGGLSLRWGFLEFDGFRLGLGVRGEVTYYRYFDTPLLPERTALVTGLTLIGERR